MAAKFLLTMSENGKFMFNLRAANGEVILTSQLYEAKARAEEGIESVRRNSVFDEQFERKTAGDGESFFVLRAPNKQIIGRSELYTSTAGAEKGIASVKRNASLAELEDATEKKHKSRVARHG
jgi:uncharacterized protein YegP (UPF0339 family)